MAQKTKDSSCWVSLVLPPPLLSRPIPCSLLPSESSRRPQPWFELGDYTAPPFVVVCETTEPRKRGLPAPPNKRAFIAHHSQPVHAPPTSPCHRPTTAPALAPPAAPALPYSAPSRFNAFLPASKPQARPLLLRNAPCPVHSPTHACAVRCSYLRRYAARGRSDATTVQPCSRPLERAPARPRSAHRSRDIALLLGPKIARFGTFRAHFPHRPP